MRRGAGRQGSGSQITRRESLLTRGVCPEPGSSAKAVGQFSATKELVPAGGDKPDRESSDRRGTDRTALHLGGSLPTRAGCSDKTPEPQADTSSSWGGRLRDGSEGTIGPFGGQRWLLYTVASAWCEWWPVDRAGVSSSPDLHGRKRVRVERLATRPCVSAAGSRR